MWIAGTARTAISDPLRVSDMKREPWSWKKPTRPATTIARTVAQPERPGREVERIILSGSADSDAATDQAAADVLAAYEAAQAARKSKAECHSAGVEGWRRVHPDQTLEYTARRAVAVILAVKVSLRIPDE